MSATSSHTRFQPWRLVVVYAGVGLVFTAIISRLLTMQVFDTQNWVDSSVENFTREVSVQAPRGIILDRNGFVLARNVASYNLVITPADLPDDPADIQRIYREVSALIGRPVSRGTVEDAKLINICLLGDQPGPGIKQLVELGESNAPYSPVDIDCYVSEEIARVVREKEVDWPGVSIKVEPIRDYPTGSLTADIIGFLGPIPASQEEQFRTRGYVPNRDKIGYAGVESSLQDVLTGTNGTRTVEVDVAGRELRNILPPVAAQPGYNVRLTIDTRLQAAAQAALVTEIDSWNAYYGKIRISSGVAIAMNPKTGEILAMVSYPTYENNRMAREISGYYYRQLEQDPRHPLLNNAIQSIYPPGSVFKLSTATGALNEHVVTVDKIIEAPGQLLLCEQYRPNEPCTESNTRPFRDWIYDTNPAGFGTIDFLHCIAFSSNVCFYKLGGGYKDEIPEGLGIWRLKQYARALGYDQPSNIEFVGEARGLIPDPDWKRINQGENWSTGDTYISSVGQGYVGATPLQVIMSGATIANDGKLMQPTLVREVLDGQGRAVEKWWNPDDYSVTDRPTAANSYQISPFVPNMKWDITKDQKIEIYSCDLGYCDTTDTFKSVDPYVVGKIQEGMRLAVTDTRFGTLRKVFGNFPIAVAGKTGTAEYCDDVARKAGRCAFGQWPTHSWTMAFAPYEDPEIIILAFAYNGGEGASVAAPIVGKIMKAYFDLKAIDIAQGGGLANP
jgi:penicillin-binding protein 2